VWLDGVQERDGVDAATALFSESTARVVVAVPREEDVKFVGLCAGRRVPALRIGVTDAESGVLEVQDRFALPVEELRTAYEGTLPAHLGPRVAETAILAGP
jgi:phosphoribosylformylglycinamidine synthase